MAKLFINYRTADKFTKLIHQHLRGLYGAENVFFDKEHLSAGVNWKAALKQGVKDCELMISVIGEYWCDPSAGGGLERLHRPEDWVRQEIEWAVAFEKPILPVLLDVPQLPEADELPVSLRFLQDIQCLPINTDQFEREIKQLVEDLKRLGFAPIDEQTGSYNVNTTIQDSKNTVQGNDFSAGGNIMIGDSTTTNITNIYNTPSADKHPVTSNKPIYLNRSKTRFTLTKTQVLGREKELARLTEQLQNSNELVLISGLGGIGKTTLANYYLSQHQSNFDHVGWISCTGNFKNDLLNSLNALPKSDSTDLEVQFRERMQALQGLGGNSILVIDNINTQSEAEEVLQYKGYFPNHFKLLMTARVQLQGFPTHQIGVLDEADAIALFKKHYAFKAGDTDAQLTELLQHIGRHTLVIEMLAKGMAASGRLNLERMLQRIADKGLQSIKVAASSERSGNISKPLNEFVAFVFDLSFADIAEENWMLLQQLSVLPPLPHDFDLLAQLLGRDEESEQDDLDTQLSTLQRKGLIDYKAEQITLHPVLREVINEKATLSYATVATIVPRLADILDYDNINPEHNLFERQPFMVYGEAVVKMVEKFEEQTIVDLLGNLGYLKEQYGLYQESALLKEKSLKLAQIIYEVNHSELSKRQSNLANVYRNLGRYAEAANLLEQALASDLKNFGKEHPSVAVSQSNLANVYGDLGRYEQAANLLEQALASAEKNFGKEHPSVAVRQSNLANVYGNLGRYDEAANLLEQALASDLKNFGKDHPEVAKKQSNLANVYRNLGRYEEAANLLEQALASAEKNFGKEHPTVAFTLNNLAFVELDTKAYQSAAAHFIQAYQIFLNQLGAEHPNTNAVLNSLTSCLQKGAAAGDAYCQELLKKQEGA